MWKAFREKPAVAVLVSLWALLTTLVVLPAALANIWVAFSRDTVPEFLAKRSWGMAIPSWQAWPLLGASFALLGFQVWLLREASRQRVAAKVPTGATAAPPYPTVTIYEHLAAQQSLVRLRIRTLFEDAGWKVIIARTDVERHRQGVWIHGGTDVERNVAKWGLQTLGVVPQVDYTDDNPPNLQVIVGAADAVEPPPSTDDFSRLRQERDTAVATVKQVKRDYGLTILRMLSGMRFRGGEKPTVVIRFARYEHDYKLAREIEKIFRDVTDWNVTLDGSNTPVLHPDDRFKVIFESGLTMSFEKVTAAFSEGDLLGVPVGQRVADRGDEDRLVVEVLPGDPQP